MANPDKRTILLEQTYDEIKVICTKFLEESGASFMEVKKFIKGNSQGFGKKIFMMISILIGKFK